MKYFRQFFSKGPTKQEKNVTKNPHIAAVFDCRSTIVGYYYSTCIFKCAYNIDDLYHTWQIDPPSRVKVVLIVCDKRVLYVHRIYPFQSQKSRSCRSFSRLEVSAGSINQASAKLKDQLVQFISYSSAHHNIIILAIESIAGSNHLTNARKPSSPANYIHTYLLYLAFFFSRDRHTKQKKKCCTLKIQHATVYDCRTVSIHVQFSLYFTSVDGVTSVRRPHW